MPAKQACLWKNINNYEQPSIILRCFLLGSFAPKSVSIGPIGLIRPINL